MSSAARTRGGPNATGASGADGTGAGAAAAAVPPPASPLTSSSLPDHLIHLSTLVLVSRAATSGSTSSANGPVGFTHVREQPLDALAHLLTSYLALAAQSAAHAANLAGRAHVVPWDIATALGEIGYRGRHGLDELMHEATRGDDGVEEEAEQLRQLARGLQGPSPVLIGRTAHAHRADL